ncbi:hypothetical protein GCM10027454_39860 [Algoriphagus aestuariicola]
MKKKYTFALFWYLLFTSLYGINSLANPYSLLKPYAVSNDLLTDNFSHSMGRKPNEAGEELRSNEDDFVIRRKVDFEDHPNGYYTNTQYKSDWNNGSLYFPNTTQIRTVDGSKVLASFFPKGTWGRGGGLNQWPEFRDSPDNITEIYWTFRIKYQGNFDWALGAKLPGVGFGLASNIASGGEGLKVGNQGASLRLMQVAGGKLKMYVYHHNMGNKYGDDMGQGTFGQLERGVWQELTVRVVANQNGKANGIMQVWLDGELVASARNIEMRTSASPQTIRSIALNTFMGGDDSRFAPDHDQFMWMDDMHFWQYSSEFLAANPSVARGLELHPESHKLYTPISGSAGSNARPTISITSPESEARFSVGSNFSIAANATDRDGTIAKVEFYDGNNLLGTDTSSPYRYYWSNAKAGLYTITAKAIDNKGASTTSDEVEIQIGSSEQVENVSSDSGVEAGFLDGLVSFYEMNTNSSGVLRDSHGSNHGNNSSISHTTGFDEKGNRYNGSSSISRVPHSNSLNLTTELTLMADIYREGSGQYSGSVIVGKTFSSGWPQNQAYSIAITGDNKIRIRTYSGKVRDWVSTQTVPLRKWVRVIATYKSGEGYTLYLNTTKPEKSGDISGTLYQSSEALTIGSAQAGYRRRVQGVLDNVAIWNRKLSSSEIEELITTKATYPDFVGGQTYRVAVTSDTDQTPVDVKSQTPIEAQAGEKLLFFAEEEIEGKVEFDYWSLDGVQVSDQAVFELDMPEKNVTLTKHFKSFGAPEIRVVLPEGKSEFEAFGDVHIELEIEENDAEIKKVELYDDETLVGELGENSSGIDWTGIPEGTHELVAKATDASGKVHLSSPVVLKAFRSQSKDIRQVLLDYVIGPNPAMEQLNVIFKNLDGIYDFEINVVSMSGIIQKSVAVRPEGSEVIIDVSDLKTGIYILQLNANGNALSSKKFIKQ